MLNTQYSLRLCGFALGKKENIRRIINFLNDYKCLTERGLGFGAVSNYLVSTMQVTIL